MNIMLQTLADISRKHPLEEKIILSGSYVDGNELCQALARASGGYLNLRPETFTGLAFTCLEGQLYEQGLTLINGYTELILVEEIITRLEQDDHLQYFSRSGEAPGLIAAIGRSIRELRQAGIKHSHLSLAAFLSSEKGRDIQHILQQYETLLAEKKYIDNTMLLQLFLEFIAQHPEYRQNKIFILPAFLQLNPLEKQLADALAVIYLPSELLSCADLSGTALCSRDPQASQSDCRAQVQRLKFLFHPEQSPPPLPDDSIKLFHAYGEYNEAREVLRSLYSQGIPLDQVLIAYQNPQYIKIFEHLANKLGFNITVAEGFPLIAASPGKAAAMILDWVTHDYSLRTLKPLLLEGCIRIVSKDQDTPLYPQQLLNLLRQAAVGKGAAQYLRLQEKADEYRQKASQLPADDHRAENSQRSESLYQLAYGFFSELIGSFPAIDAAGLVDFPQLLQALLQAVEQLAVIRNNKDLEALQILKTAFKDIMSVSERKYTPEQAREKIMDLLKGLRVGSSGSRAGALHLVRYSRLLYSNRPYTYIVGLDGHSFPGHSGQDPILLDTERALISPDLELQEDKSRQREQLMGVALASRRGKVTLSYSSYDTGEGRKNYPSSLLLRVLRLIKADPELDYSDLNRHLGPALGYCLEERSICLDELEWWLSQILTRRTGNLDQVLSSYYPGVQRGMNAYEARSEAVISEYDGQIQVRAEELDPRANPEGSVSCSRLEMMAKCPFKYFLTHVLRVTPPEENIPDDHRWLDPMQRGSLLHQVYEEFMIHIISSQEQVAYDLHLELIQEIAWNIINEYRETITPPSQAVFKFEVAQILLCCEIFLKCEEESEYQAVCLEAPFGLGEEAVKRAGGGLPGPLQIPLPGQQGLTIRGIIDRIDHIRDDLYAVWDYKTGSTYAYSEAGHFVQGQQIQHAIYSLAAVEILRQQGIDDPVIDVSGYYFPSDKGEGQRFYRQPRVSRQLQRVLELLCQLMADGQFLATADVGSCTYCDYQEVCRYRLAVEKMKFLLKDDNTMGLECRRELSEFE